MTSRDPGRRWTSKNPARSCPTCQPRSRRKLSRGEKSTFVNRPDGTAAPSTAASSCVPAGSDTPGEDVVGLGRLGGCDRGVDVADEQLVAMQAAAANATRMRIRAIGTAPKDEDASDPRGLRSRHDLDSTSLRDKFRASGG